MFNPICSKISFSDLSDNFLITVNNVGHVILNSKKKFDDVLRVEYEDINKNTARSKRMSSAVKTLTHHQYSNLFQWVQSKKDLFEEEEEESESEEEESTTEYSESEEEESATEYSESESGNHAVKAEEESGSEYSLSESGHAMKAEEEESASEYSSSESGHAMSNGMKEESSGINANSNASQLNFNELPHFNVFNTSQLNFNELANFNVFNTSQNPPIDNNYLEISVFPGFST